LQVPFAASMARLRHFQTPSFVLRGRVAFVRVEGLWPCTSHYGSVHESCMSVFCDGSVHAISFNIDKNVWYHLCGINDGQPITLDD
jgi:hypothetical protein